MNGSPTTGHARVVLPSAQPMYAAARRWRDEALVGDASLFDGRPIDGVRAAEGLLLHYAGNLDAGEGKFLQKLRGQLADADADAVQVAAELLFVHCLIMSTDSMRSRTKLERVDTVVRFREHGTSGPPPELCEALRGGVARPGQGYNNFRWKMLLYLVRVFAAVKALAPQDRRSAVSTPERFGQVLAGIDEQSVWLQRYALEHLLFPDDCPAVLSRGDRKLIEARLGAEGESVADIVRRLEPNVRYGDRAGVNLYRTPYREQWQAPKPALHTYASWGARLLVGGVELDELERDHKLEVVPRITGAVETARRGEDPTAEIVGALRSANLVNHRVVDELRQAGEADPAALAAALRELAVRPGAESIDRFLEHVPTAGQLSGRGARLNVASTLLMGLRPYDCPPWRDNAYTRTVELTDGYPPQESATAGELYVLFLERLDVIVAAMREHGVELRDRLDAQGLAWALATYEPPQTWPEAERQAFVDWREKRSAAGPQKAPAVAGRVDVDDVPAAASAATTEELAAELGFAPDDVSWLEETVDMLREKRQLILQGPPGTGKTHLALRLAEHVAGDADRVRLVQFHPAYAYEDFVAGLRPDPAEPTRFAVVDGPFVRLATLAEQRPDQTFVLVIDEINRGNVPAVFGELYFLLEYRDRAVTMTYGDVFALPPNVWLIGTMNTADRSITSLDSALRRRFYIRDLRPGEAPLHGVLRNHLRATAPDLLWLADLLDRANDILDDPEQAIGPTFFLGAGTERHARRSWEHSVLPTLRELFHDRPDDVSRFDFDTLKAQVVTADGDVVAD